MYRWRTGEMIGLPEKCVHDRKREVDRLFVYHERQLASIAFLLRSDVGLPVMMTLSR